jgi:phosphomannomutase
MDLIRGISGIRGIVNDTLTDSVIKSHVQAFSILQKEGIILLARDSRSHGETFIISAAEALKKCGREVINYDIIPTPTAQFLIDKNNLAGGIVITASHNPKEWNGLKFIDADSCFLNGNKNKKLFDIADSGPEENNNIGSIQSITNGYLPHINHTRRLSFIDTDAIENRKFSIVVDAVNGAASKALPAMVEALGCTVHHLYCDQNGKFSRGAEPLPHNLENLGKAVRNLEADAGFATDPDGDRLAIVDEKGNPLGEEYTLTICADGYFQSASSSAPIVTNLSTTMALDKVAEKFGRKVIRSAVGEINVVNKMKEVGAQLGGEGNGGVILPESHYGRDSLVGATMFLNRMAQDNLIVSKIFQSMPKYIMIKDKIELDSVNPQTAFDKIEAKYLDADTDKTDGLKLSWGNSWVHIRKSNTEHIIRIYAEAPTRDEADEIVKKIKIDLNI